MDEKDQVLISSLRRNARESLVGLARRVGLSRTATQERLRRLERSGVIKGYTIRLDDAQDPAVRAIIAVTLQPNRRCDDVVPHIIGLPEIVSCQSLAGPIDMLLTVSCESNAAFSAVRETIAATPGVATAVTHVVLSTHWVRAS